MGEFEELDIDEKGIISIIEERLQDIVNSIENQIQNAQNSQREIEYKKWYPYEIQDVDWDAMMDRVIEQLIPNSDEIDHASDQYQEIIQRLTPILSESMCKLKDGRRVRVRIETTGKTYSKAVQYLHQGNIRSLGTW
jgi:predicted DNA-binding antitoxin AbrB/MazE fold protein